MPERLALVTGGAGLIGSHLADLLLTSGWRVRILDNLEPQTHGGGRPPWIAADLIIIEASRLSPFLALAGLSPVHRIVRCGHCPVLLVPAAPRPSPALRLGSAFRRIWTR